MPLASWASLHFNGPAAAAGVVAVPASVVTGAVKARARAQGTTSGSAAITLAKPTRLRNRPATLTGVGVVQTALPKGRAKPSVTIRVNNLTQDDVTGAVLESFVEPGVTLKQAIRLTLAVLAGKSDVTGGTVSFRDINDDITRVAAVVNSSGERTAVTINATDA